MQKKLCGSTNTFAYIHVAAVIYRMVYGVHFGWNPELRTPFLRSLCNDAFRKQGSHSTPSPT